MVKHQVTRILGLHGTVRDYRVDFIGGRGGIRTHGTLTRTAVFKTAALNRSATRPAPAQPNAGGASRQAPLHQRERRIGGVVRLEHGLDHRPDRHSLQRIAQQVPDHPDVAVFRQFDQHRDVRAVSV